MPTYEYKCSDCGEIFEEFQSMSAPHLTECKFCKGRVSRLISGGSGLIFKGSGFYITDYRSDSYKKSASSDRASATPAITKTSDKKSESKTNKVQSSAKTAS